MIRYYIGIDPGATGGIAAIEKDGTVSWGKMPKTEWNVWTEVCRYDSTDQTVAVIERIGRATWGKGKAVTSLTSLYGSYTALRMALTAA